MESEAGAIHLRLFGPARVAARCSADQFPATTVGEVLAICITRYGTDLARLIPSCAVWVNGEPATPSTPVHDGDEVAILPPVSGGS
jgi:molybdopterin converting factor small subunit